MKRQIGEFICRLKWCQPCWWQTARVTSSKDFSLYLNMLTSEIKARTGIKYSKGVGY